MAGGKNVISDVNVNYPAGIVGVMTSGLAYLTAGTYYYLTSYQTVGAPLAITDLELIIMLVSKA